MKYPILVLALELMFACRPAQAQGPVDTPSSAVRRFLAAADSSDWSIWWSCLAEESRAFLCERAVIELDAARNGDPVALSSLIKSLRTSKSKVLSMSGKQYVRRLFTVTGTDLLLHRFGSVGSISELFRENKARCDATFNLENGSTLTLHLVMREREWRIVKPVLVTPDLDLTLSAEETCTRWWEAIDGKNWALLWSLYEREARMRVLEPFLARNRERSSGKGRFDKMFEDAIRSDWFGASALSTLFDKNTRTFTDAVALVKAGVIVKRLPGNQAVVETLSGRLCFRMRIQRLGWRIYDDQLGVLPQADRPDGK